MIVVCVFFGFLVCISLCGFALGEAFSPGPFWVVWWELSVFVIFCILCFGTFKVFMGGF